MRRVIAVVPLLALGLAAREQAKQRGAVVKQRVVVEAPAKCEPIACTVLVDTRHPCDDCVHLEEREEDSPNRFRFWQCRKMREYICPGNETPWAAPDCGGPYDD